VSPRNTSFLTWTATSPTGGRKATPSPQVALAGHPIPFYVSIACLSLPPNHPDSSIQDPSESSNLSTSSNDRNLGCMTNVNEKGKRKAANSTSQDSRLSVVKPHNQTKRKRISKVLMLIPRERFYHYNKELHHSKWLSRARSILSSFKLSDRHEYGIPKFNWRIPSAFSCNDNLLQQNNAILLKSLNSSSLHPSTANRTISTTRNIVATTMLSSYLFHPVKPPPSLLFLSLPSNMNLRTPAIAQQQKEIQKQRQ